MAKVLWSIDGKRWTVTLAMRLKLLKASREMAFANPCEHVPEALAPCFAELAELPELPAKRRVVASGWLAPPTLPGFSLLGLEIELPDRRVRVYALYTGPIDRLCVTHSEHWIGLERIPAARAAKIAPQ